MKKIIISIAFIIMILIGAFAVHASSGFDTVITEKDGSTRVEQGIVEADADALGYEIRYNGKRILTVKQDIKGTENEGGFNLLGTETKVGGYYSVEFEVSQDEGISAFIAGLSKTNKDEVQAALINAANRNKKIELESLDFIDTEKKPGPNDSDNLLCWAAAESNVLYYTGWGEKAGFESEDDLFDFFESNFINGAGNVYHGLTWFFNGVYEPQGADTWAQLKDYENRAGYMTDYCIMSIFNFFHKNVHEFMPVATDALRDGAGVGLGITWLEGDTLTGGHEVTLWGYVYDNRYENDKSNLELIKALIISDSDSDRDNTERRMSPNKLQIYPAVRKFVEGEDSLVLLDYSGDGAVADELHVLTRYSDDIPKETDPAATRNIITSPEYYPIGFDSFSGGISHLAFKEGEVINIAPIIKSFSEQRFNLVLDYEVEINSQTYRGSSPVNMKLESTKTLSPVEIQGLPVGVYDLRITINPDKTVEEAYYYNNTVTYPGVIKVLNDYPDVSQASMSATFIEQEYDSLKFSFEYENVNSVFDYIGEGCQTILSASYYEDGEWSDWERIGESDDCDGAFPAEGYSDVRGTKVRFAAHAYSADKPCLTVYSGEYDIEYTLLWVQVAKSNTKTYSRLPENACSLAEGEKFAFKVSNGSTAGAADAKLDLKLFAVNTVTDEEVVLFEENGLTLANGGEPILVEISSWSNEIDLSGRYKVYGGYIEETEGECFTDLGTIEVREHTSTRITTDQNVVDDYDGITSLKEAFAVCGENDVITVEPEISIIYINDTIVVDKPVKIDFSKDNSVLGMVNPYGAALGTAISAERSCRGFKVVEGGELDARCMAVIRGDVSENGGGILIDGGNVTLEQCRLFDCSAARSGGGIYVKDGKLTLNGCSFKMNVSGYGGAIAVGEDGEADLLNCTLFLNESNSGAIYAAGRISAINSTFVDNTLKSSGGSAVTALAGADATLVNCIAVGDNALNKNVKVYGCILGRTEYYGAENGSKLNIPVDKLFRTDSEGEAEWEGYGSGACIQYTPHLSKTAEMPSSVRVTDGKISLYDGENTVMTDVIAVFSNEELSKDALGNPNDGFCGSQKIKIDDTELQLSGQYVTVYTYEGGDAALVCAEYDGENRLIAFDQISDKINNGTNRIYLDVFYTSPQNSGYRKIMLWDGLDTMRPLTEAVTK